MKHNDFEKIKSHYKITRIGMLPESLCESSGMQFHSKDVILNHNDSGNEAELYAHDQTGQLLYSVKLPFKNKDWEDITKDQKGNIYIGDIGNNSNKRKDLTIYKLDSTFRLIGEIHFSFADQEKFPPSENNLNYDCEALVHGNDSLYVISKNRSDRNVKTTSLINRALTSLLLKILFVLKASLLPLTSLQTIKQWLYFPMATFIFSILENPSHSILPTVVSILEEQHKAKA